MSKREVTETQLVHGVEHAVKLWDGPEVGFRIGDRKFQNLSDGFSFVGDFQGFAIETFTKASRAFGPCIRQEMHFDFELAVALAALAATALGVEGESAFAVTPLFGERKLGEKIADQFERAYERRGIGSRGAADGGLIDEDEFLNGFEAADRIMCAGFFFGVVKMFGERLGKDVVGERGFSATGRTGKNDDLMERDCYR